MKKFLFYLRYIVIHKYYVFKECCKYGLYWRGLVHDLSKLTPYEFFPYMEYFYNNPANESYFKLLKTKKLFNSDEIMVLHDLEMKVAGIKHAFDYAWNAHQKYNKHHHQYWLLKNDDGTLRPLEMPMNYRKEMIADWLSCGKIFNNNPYDWYIKNKDKMILGKYTRTWVEKELLKYKS